MEQIKRQLSNDFDNSDHFKRQKSERTTDETHCLTRKSISYIESLSNELIYEIFEYLDYFHVYQAFSSLNQRFYNLVNKSNLPIKINIPTMSKSALKRYNEDFIKPNISRIKSFRFGDVLTNDFTLSLIPNLSDFQRLETLIIYEIEPKSLENILNQLCSLPLLSSLIITSLESATRTNPIYRQVFRLPALKYCKISVPAWASEELLPVCSNAYSSIEQLIIVDDTYSDVLDRLLSYVPKLRRLSSHPISRHGSKTTTISSNLIRYLTHVSFKLSSIKFNDFIQIFEDVFQNIEVLHTTIESFVIDRAYIDANNWKHVISTYMPKLRIFDFLCSFRLCDTDTLLGIETEINQFNSSFWIERQWFFTYHVYHNQYAYHSSFYSINPYRKKHYTLYRKVDKTKSLYDYRSSLNSVEHVHIQSDQGLSDCKYYFPNATDIIFEDGFSTIDLSIAPILNSTIPLNQLTKLVFKCSRFSVQKMIKLLYNTPNLHTLTLTSMPCYKQRNDYTSIQQSEEFQFVSGKNNIEKVTYYNVCKLEEIKLLLSLCPRVNYLTINTRLRNMEPIIQFLLDSANPNTRHLCVLCLSNSTSAWPNKLKRIIESKALLDDYILKQIGGNLYLWW